ncbi:HupE/UreJ family protein [Paenibacillus sp. OK003]|uniref:HupE/UreJ family protein n=1 Tax=Paenibacillus sp. OK003 TaxID=1884380 RepID=UPI0008C2BE5D|nr:HupE/UreJ family protein [Paenibacillus sp. OK003]SEL72066.1 Hydrogenase/urease accessory protein HupE [Paenibacillus sp. OK003]
MNSSHIYTQLGAKRFFSVFWIILFTLAMTTYPRTAQAHPLSASYTNIDFGEEKTTVDFSIDELSVLENIKADTNNNEKLDQDELDVWGDKIADWIGDSIALEADGRQQAETLLGLDMKDENGTRYVTIHWQFPAYPSGTTITINDGLYYNNGNTTYTNLLAATQGGQLSQAILQGKEREWTILLTENQVSQEQSTVEQQENTTTATPSSTSSDSTPGAKKTTAQSPGTRSAWVSFLELGMKHILGGYDHLLFLLALLLGRQTFKQYALTITAFTVAHSITLTLTYLDLIHLPSKWIEAGIALSIVYVAVENIFLRNIRIRWLITFLFGLIHGMGFADILMGMHIPAKEVAIDLASFNIGIEMIQLALVAIALPILTYLQKRTAYNTGMKAASWLIAAAGAFWLVERLL